MVLLRVGFGFWLVEFRKLGDICRGPILSLNLESILNPLIPILINVIT